MKILDPYKHFIPYGHQHIDSTDIKSIVSVLKSDWLTQGPEVPNFETSLCNYVNSTYAVAVNSATSALHIACLALGLKENDWLWTSPNTFVASANVARMCGAKVDFIDINLQNYNICLAKLEEKLFHAKTENKLPKIIMPVHFAGQSVNMKGLHALSKKYNFKIIEDASHALGGSFSGERIGNCRFSDITIFSFHPVKIITTGEGGAAVTNNLKLAEKMYSLRSHGITYHKNNSKTEIFNYSQNMLGFNYRMTDISATLGRNQLLKVESFIEKRRKIAHKYYQSLKNLPIILPFQESYSESSFHLFPIRIIPNGNVRLQKDVYEFLISKNVGVNLHYIPVYRHPYYKFLGFKKGYCPNAEEYFHTALSLPIFPNLKNIEQQFIIKCLKTILS